MGYWTTDFLVVQRVFAAKDIRSAKLAPVIGAFFKMAVPLIVILPGLLGLALLPEHLVPESALQPGQHSYNEVLPLMLARYFGPGLLGLGVTALVAGFMAGMAGNVSAFATVWTYDIYRPFLRKTAPDAHYVSVGRWCMIIGLVVSIGTAYLAMGFASIMDYVQALFSFFIAPLFGTVVLGMLWKRVTAAGGFYGLLAGTLSSVGMFFLVKFDPGDARDRGSIVPRKGAGRGYVSGVMVVPDRRYCDGRRESGDEAETGFRVEGAGLRSYRIPTEGNLKLLARPVFWAAVAIAILLILQWIFW